MNGAAPDMRKPAVDLAAEIAFFRERAGVPAVGAAVLTADGLQAVEVCGVRQRGGTAAALPSDAWHIGSCTKALSAALVARLVEEGRAEWNMPVERIFSDLDERPSSEWKRRTLEDLLLGISGLKANPSPRQMSAHQSDQRPLEAQRTALTAAVLGATPGPQGRFRYSNLGYIVIGAAIERLSGQTFEAALKHHVLDPLGMTSVGYGAPPGLCGHHARLRLGSFLAFPGKPAMPADEASDNLRVFSSAGTVHVALQDWSRFVQQFLMDGGRLLQPSSVEHLLRKPANSDMAMGWLATPSSTDTSHVFQGSNTLWTAGVALSRKRKVASLEVCNDGRSSVMMKAGALAERMLGLECPAAHN